MSQPTPHPLYRLVATWVNIALWIIKAWGLSQDEMVEEANMPTGILCTTHSITAIFLGLGSVVVCSTLILAESVSMSNAVGSTLTIYTVLYIIVGLHLRYHVDRRCRAQFPQYDYVKHNLDLLR